MADLTDPPQGFRAELLAAIAVIEPQLEGLDTLSKAGLSEPITKIILATYEGRQRRKALIQYVITALNVVLEKWAQLIADGYPTLPQSTVSEALAKELEEEMAAILAAKKIFEAALRATTMKVTLGEATPKT